jgi:hypothetical protein
VRFGAVSGACAGNGRQRFLSTRRTIHPNQDSSEQE